MESKLLLASNVSIVNDVKRPVIASTDKRIAEYSSQMSRFTYAKVSAFCPTNWLYANFLPFDADRPWSCSSLEEQDATECTAAV